MPNAPKELGGVLFLGIGAFVVAWSMYRLLDGTIPREKESVEFARETTGVSRLDEDEDLNRENPQYQVGGSGVGMPVGNSGIETGISNGLAGKTMVPHVFPGEGLYYFQHVDSSRNLGVADKKVSTLRTFSEPNKFYVLGAREDAKTGFMIESAMSRGRLVPNKSGVVQAIGGGGTRWDIVRGGENDAVGVFTIGLAGVEEGKVKYLTASGKLGDGYTAYLTDYPARWSIMPVGSSGTIKY
jgi:hypothetical protein